MVFCSSSSSSSIECFFPGPGKNQRNNEMQRINQNKTRAQNK